MAFLKSKAAKKDPWESIFSDYGITNPYAIKRETVVKQIPTEHPIVTIGGETSGKSFFNKTRVATPKQTGFYDSNADFIPLSKEQLADLGDKKTFTTYEPTETQVFIDATTGKEIKSPSRVFSFGAGGQGYQLKKEGDISYRVKFDESGNPSFYAKKLEDDSFGSFLEEGLLAISPVLLAGFPIGSVLGSALAPTLSAATQAVIGNALVQGTLAEMQGGEFLKGAAGGAIGAGVGNFVTPGISQALGGGQFGNIAAGALTGGGIAELTGGDFLQGALRGGVSAGISDYQQQLRQEAFDTAMTESGLAGQTSVEGFQPPVVEAAAPTIQDVISQITVPTQDQLQPAINELITQLAPYEVPPEIIPPTQVEQTVLTQEQIQPAIDDLIAELAPYEVPPTQEIVVTAPREQTVPTQEETQLSIDDLLTELAPYEVPEIPEIVITAPREQTVLTQEQMQPEIDDLLTELAPYEVIPEAIDTSAGLQTVPTQEEAQLSVNELLTELAPYEVPPNQVLAEPDVQPEPVDNSRFISALDVLKVISPAVITALLADNASQTTTETPEQTGFPILPIPGDWRSPTYNQAFTPSAPIDFGTSALLAGTQWENLPQFQQEQPYSLSNLINTLNYQSVPFVQQQYQMPEQTLNVNDVVSQYRTTPTVGTRDIIGNLGGKPVSIADIISEIQSQYG